MRLLLTIAGLAVLTALSACGGRAGELEKQTARTVTLVTARQEKVVRPVRASGLLAASREVALSFKTGGIIQTLRVDEGHRFKKGEILATLDMREIRAYAEQARAGLEKAERDVRRVEKLYADSAAALEQLQNARTALTAARARYEAARFNEEQGRIIAPFDGVVLKRLRSMGEMSGPGTPVLLVGNQPAGAIVKAALSDSDILRLQPGDRAELRFDAWPGTVFNGRVSRLAGKALPGSGVFEIEIALDKTTKKLLSGFVASVTLFPGREEERVVIPAAALSEASEKKAYVFVYDDGAGIVRRKRVSVAHIMDGRIALSDGLLAGTRIVEHGAAYLNNGDRVIIKTSQALSPAQ